MAVLPLSVPTLFALASLAPWVARAPALAAQSSPLALELSAGAAYPLGSFRSGAQGGAQLERAPTFGLRIVRWGGGGWGQYLGFSQHRFDCAAELCPLTGHVLTAWDAGVAWTLGRHAWLRAGLTTGRAERCRAAGELQGEEGEAGACALSSLGVGAEAGAGLVLGLGGTIALGPAVRYGWLDTRYPEGGRVRARWLAVELGLSLGF